MIRQFLGQLGGSDGLSDRLLISAQVSMSGLWVQGSHWALHGAWSLRRKYADTFRFFLYKTLSDPCFHSHCCSAGTEASIPTSKGTCSSVFRVFNVLFLTSFLYPCRANFQKMWVMRQREGSVSSSVGFFLHDWREAQPQLWVGRVLSCSPTWGGWGEAPCRLGEGPGGSPSDCSLRMLLSLVQPQGTLV